MQPAATGNGPLVGQDREIAGQWSAVTGRGASVQ